MAAPIGQTCPDINKLIRGISAMDLDRADKHYILDELENLRSGNEKLRKWGEESEASLENSQQELAEMEDRLIETQAELEKARKVITATIGADNYY